MTDPTPTAPGLDAEDREALVALLIENRSRAHPISAYLFDPHDMADAILVAGWRSPEHVAAAKAEALREAADEMEATIADLRPTLGGAELSYANCTRLDVRLLRDRADRYEAAGATEPCLGATNSPETMTPRSSAPTAASPFSLPPTQPITK